VTILVAMGKEERKKHLTSFEEKGEGARLQSPLTLEKNKRPLKGKH